MPRQAAVELGTQRQMPASSKQLAANASGDAAAPHLLQASVASQAGSFPPASLLVSTAPELEGVDIPALQLPVLGAIEEAQSVATESSSDSGLEREILSTCWYLDLSRCIQ
ncbi:hypothetical protein WJX73_009623 [Symbiochloris irregularis]|uniref:Uncharacterized protein n=1 Tax=Symbiochloris irregularis TaxID=706552 RepID=A0AAW1NNY0_9CHLO